MKGLIVSRLVMLRRACRLLSVRRTALHAAAFNDQVECLQLLLARGGRVDEADSYGRTSLMLAAHNGHAGTVGESATTTTRRQQ